MMTRIYLGIAPSSRVIIIISLQINSNTMKASAIYKNITAILSLSNLLFTALGITDCLENVSSTFTCISEIRLTQQRLMLR